MISLARIYKQILHNNLMGFNINNFEDIEPVRGGRRTPALTLGKTAYFRGNKFFIKEHKLGNAKSVKIKALKEEKIITVALAFFNSNEENSFKVSFGEKDGELTSIWFSGRSIFSQYNIDYKDVIRTKSLLLKPTIQEHDGKKYFVVEIPLKTPLKL